MTNAVVEFLEHECVKLVQSERLDAHGHVDYQHKNGQPIDALQSPGFPPYSPDLNMVIEKAWRHIDKRVKKRHREIKSEDDMRKVVLEEWDRLAFDDSQVGETPSWPGINYYVDLFAVVCSEVIEENGFDTHFMR